MIQPKSLKSHVDLIGGLSAGIDRISELIAFDEGTMRSEMLIAETLTFKNDTDEEII